MYGKKKKEKEPFSFLTMCFILLTVSAFSKIFKFVTTKVSLYDIKIIQYWLKRSQIYVTEIGRNNARNVNYFLLPKIILMGMLERDCIITSARHDEAQPDTTWPQRGQRVATTRHNPSIDVRCHLLSRHCERDSVGST